MLDKLSKNTNFKSKKVQLAVLTFLLASLPFFVFLAGKEVKNRLLAAPTAHLTLVPLDQNGNPIPQNTGNSSYTLPVGEQIYVDVMLTTSSEQIESAIVSLDYPSDVLSINHSANPVSVDDNGLALYSTTDIVCGTDPANQFLPTNYLGQAWLRGVNVDSNTNQILDLRFICGSGLLQVPFSSLQPAPSNQTMKIARIAFTVLTETQSSSISFKINSADLSTSPTSLTAVGCQSALEACGPDITCQAQVPECQNNIDVNNTTNMVFDAQTPGTGATLALSPASGTYDNGDQFDVNIMLNTGTYQVSNVNAELHYDPTFLSVANITHGTVFPNYVTTPSQAGTIKIDGNIDTVNPLPVSGSNLQFATITFQALNPGASASSTSVDIYYTAFGDKNDSNVTEFLQSGDEGNDVLNMPVTLDDGVYTINPVAIPTPTSIPPTNTPTPIPTATPIPTNTPTPIPTVGPNTPTPTPLPPTNTPIPTATPTDVPTPTPTTPLIPPRLQFILKLQGRNWSGINRGRFVKIIILNTIFDSNNPLNINFDKFGQNTPQDLTSVAPGTYDFLIKPNGYLQKRVSQNLVSGGNVFDLTGMTFLAGDLDDSGRIFGADYSQMLTVWESSDITDPNVVLADLDGSGEVNGLDFSLMLSNWAQCGDDEGNCP